MAAIEAVRFARAAFIERNYDRAHGMLPPETDLQFTSNKLKEMVEGMHPTGYPSVVTATDYEPILGQRAMIIYLYGENDEEKFYYRLTMSGTQENGYRVYQLYRSKEPYQSNMKRPLPVRRATG
jgi:hypothetical protein